MCYNLTHIVTVMTYNINGVDMPKDKGKKKNGPFARLFSKAPPPENSLDPEAREAMIKQAREIVSASEPTKTTLGNAGQIRELLSAAKPAGASFKEVEANTRKSLTKFNENLQAYKNALTAYKEAKEKGTGELTTLEQQYLDAQIKYKDSARRLNQSLAEGANFVINNPSEADLVLVYKDGTEGMLQLKEFTNQTQSIQQVLDLGITEVERLEEDVANTLPPPERGGSPVDYKNFLENSLKNDYEKKSGGFFRKLHRNKGRESELSFLKAVSEATGSDNNLRHQAISLVMNKIASEPHAAGSKLYDMLNKETGGVKAFCHDSTGNNGYADLINFCTANSITIPEQLASFYENNTAHRHD